MLIEKICLSAKPKIHKLASLKQSEFLYGFVLSKTTISYGSVDVVKQNHMPILVSNQWAVNTKTFKNQRFSAFIFFCFRFFSCFFFLLSTFHCFSCPLPAVLKFFPFVL